MPSAGDSLGTFARDSSANAYSVERFRTDAQSAQSRFTWVSETTAMLRLTASFDRRLSPGWTRRGVMQRVCRIGS